MHNYIKIKLKINFDPSYIKTYVIDMLNDR